MAGATLFEHIKHMIFTTAPAYLISIILYAILGFKYAGQSLEHSTN